MKIFQKIKQHISSLFSDKTYFKKEDNPFLAKNHANNDGLNHLLSDDVFQNCVRYGTKRIKTEEISEPIKKTLSSSNIYNVNKQATLIHMYKDCLKVHSALLPLIKLNISYSLDLIGGAPRDFLLNQQQKIKDLDILITLKSGLSLTDPFLRNEIHNNHLKKARLIEDNWCTENELENINFSDDDPLFMKHNKLVQLCLNRKTELSYTKIFSREERLTGEVSYGSEILTELSGILKLQSQELHYPVEILLTDHSRYDFYRSIDFGICNVGINIINLHQGEERQLAQVDKLAERFTAAAAFFKDVQDKTITYNDINKTFEQINFSFSNHLKRIEKKYPDYKPFITKDGLSEENKKFIDTVILNSTLKDNLNTKENIKPKKMKI